MEFDTFFGTFLPVVIFAALGINWLRENDKKKKKVTEALHAQRQAQREAEEHHLDKMREKHFVVGQERQCEHCGHDIWYVETTDTLPVLPTGGGPTFDVTSKKWMDRDFEDVCRKRRQIEPGDPWHEPGIGDKEQPGN